MRELNNLVGVISDKCDFWCASCLTTKPEEAPAALVAAIEELNSDHVPVFNYDDWFEGGTCVSCFVDFGPNVPHD